MTQHQRCDFYGDGKELFQIFIQNLFLILVTLGGFYFQAKVRTRSYIWAHSSFAGNRLAYHGTGWELVRGWLKAIFIFGGFSLLLIWSYLYVEGPFAEFIYEALFYTGLAALTPLAQLGAIRYRLSRTSWRGVRFSFQGQLWPFMKLSLRGLFLTAITVGFYFPEYHRRVRGYMVEHSFLGSMKLQFDGENGRKLWRIHRNAILISLAGIPILGFWYVYAPWEYQLVGNIGTVLIALVMFVGSSFAWTQYLAERQRFYWNHTTLGDARFKCTITNRGLFRVYVGNFFSC